jgi:hypothetical protein
MTDKKTYWIADVEGVKAKVEGTDALAEWTRVRGWSETTEPVGQEFQWIYHPDTGGKGVMNHEAVLLHEAAGWRPCGPDGYEEPPDEPTPHTKSPKSTAPAASGDKKE